MRIGLMNLEIKINSIKLKIILCGQKQEWLSGLKPKYNVEMYSPAYPFSMLSFLSIRKNIPRLLLMIIDKKKREKKC